MELVSHALDRSDDIVMVAELAGSAGEPHPDAFFIIDVNDAFCRMSGYGRGELIGHPFTMLAAPDGAEDMRQKLAKVIGDDGSLRTEMLCADKTGTQFWFGLHVMPCFDPAGLHRFVVLGRDITTQRRAGEQQKLTQQLLANVFILVDAAVAIVAADGRFMMANPTLDRLMRCEPGALVGTSSADWIAPAARPAMKLAQKEHAADDKQWSISSTVLRADKTEVPAQLTFAVVRLPGRHRFHIVTLNSEELRAPRVQVAGKIQLVGLDEVRATLGPKWPAMAKRAMDTAEHVLRRRLHPSETFSRTTDNGFLICFAATVSEEEAAFRAAMIGREIRTKLIGEGDEVIGNRVTAVADTVQLDAVDGTALNAMLEARLGERLAKITGTARQTLQDVVQRAQCEMEPVHGRSGRQVVGHVARLPPALEWRLDSALSALPAAEVADFDFDLMVLGFAVERVMQEALNGTKAPFMVSVGFETLSTRARADRYLERCAKIDPLLRQRLVLMIADVPPNTGKGRLGQLAFKLRPFCRKVGYVLDDLEPPQIDLATAGAPIVAINANRLQRGDDLLDREVTALCVMLHAHSAQLLVRQVPDRELGNVLGTLGVDLVSFAGSVTG
jgi:PAS domain S-box-containing protein